MSGGGPSASLHLSTSTHTGSRVKADEGREPFSDAPQRGGKQSRRAKKSPATGLTKTDARAQVELSQASPGRLVGQTHQSAPLDQSVSGIGKKLAVGTEIPKPLTPRKESPDQVSSGTGKRSAVGTERPSPMTHQGEHPDQVASGAGKRPEVGTERPDMTHQGESPDQVASGAGKRLAACTERPYMTHRGEPPGQDEPGTGRRPGTQWTAYTAQLMDRPVGPSYFISGRVEGKPV